MTAQSIGGGSDAAATRIAFAPPTGLRRSTADWWIPLLTKLVRRMPWIIGPLRPLVLGCAWRYSARMRENMMCNARRLLGESSARPQCRALAKATFACFLDSIIEVVASPSRSDAQLSAQIAGVCGLEGYHKARSARRGAILVTAHFGAFEIGMSALRRHEPKVHVVFRRDSLKAFDDVRREWRKRFQVMEAPVDDGLATWMSLREALDRDEVVLMQGDRTLPGQRGIPVPFMDGHLLMPTGPAKLAMVAGAPIIPIFAPRDADGRVRIHLHPPIINDRRDDSADPIDLTVRALAAAIELEVRAHPEQWLVVHRAWCEDWLAPSAMEVRA